MSEDKAQSSCVVIDDDPVVRQFVAHYVEQMFRITPAVFDTASEAMDYASIDREVGLVLIDWHLGDDVDGIQWIEPLGREWPSAVFIVMSADSDPQGQLEAARQRRTVLWWRKTDSVVMLASLMNLAMGEHARRKAGHDLHPISELEDAAIRDALAFHHGDIDQTAKSLGISIGTIRKHLASA